MTLCILDDMIDVAAAAETYSIRINFAPEPFRFFARPHLRRRRLTPRAAMIVRQRQREATLPLWPERERISRVDTFTHVERIEAGARH